ncbi:hypothetical protein ZYGR_0N03740 [Zygosaccharomyces rouxii]|uniref:Uncharacterized protein n=1 Tax=Zygosaccharomyces rouxii TaxID=4956 RepID=A0A1Q2ZZV3_ZYGRO|nr:hypothetical protein ZYGR_0N03740 [Zygosaccharomyces rouxii]
MSIRSESFNTTTMPTDVNEEESQSTLSWLFGSIVSGVKSFNDTLTDFVKTIDVVDADTDTDAEEDDDSNDAPSSTKKQENLVQPHT